MSHRVLAIVTDRLRGSEPLDQIRGPATRPRRGCGPRSRRYGAALFRTLSLVGTPLAVLANLLILIFA